jgi:hypothetical protein
MLSNARNGEDHKTAVSTSTKPSFMTIITIATCQNLLHHGHTLCMPNFPEGTLKELLVCHQKLMLSDTRWQEPV